MWADATSLVFDLDGTLSDPSLGIFRCHNHALAKHGYPAVTREQSAAQIGPQLDVTFAKFCPGANRERLIEVIASYRERYAESGYAENELYPDLVPARELIIQGVMVALLRKAA